MERKTENELLLANLEQLMSKQNRKVRTITFLFTIDVILILISDFVFFMMPKIVKANTEIYSASYVTAVAETYLDSYRTASLKMFEEPVGFETDPAIIEKYVPHPIYPSGAAFYDNSGYFTKGSAVGQAAWNHAFALRRAGKIYGSSTNYQCTFFAQMWFYDMYGFNSSNGASGNGSEFASIVYNSAYFTDADGNVKHAFEYGTKPRTMGIVSIYSGGVGGHVLCVDEVDYTNGTITISEGNVNGAGDIRIRQTMTLAQFYARNPGRKVYVNPTIEFVNSINSRKGR